ncbi:topoisomerase DNA-binding C4 zinc finger domain-containing protein [Azospirillum argentinense]|uniref:topoisomerase DNA-binding C4 zinc finger domain-containing protein n=1 Tax=Azospirillum argentinense TaxID=2970906 RepID=UPI0009E0489C
MEGRLQRRDGARGTFYGCSNRPYCGHTQNACPHCGTGLPVSADGSVRCLDCGQPVAECPRCDGWLQLKSGRHGPFLGCSNWPGCPHTQNVGPARPPLRPAPVPPRHP